MSFLLGSPRHTFQVANLSWLFIRFVRDVISTIIFQLLLLWLICLVKNPTSSEVSSSVLKVLVPFIFLTSSTRAWSAFSMMSRSSDLIATSHQYISCSSRGNRGWLKDINFVMFWLSFHKCRCLARTNLILVQWGSEDWASLVFKCSNSNRQIVWYSTTFSMQDIWIPD